VLAAKGVPPDTEGRADLDEKPLSCRGGDVRPAQVADRIFCGGVQKPNGEQTGEKDLDPLLENGGDPVEDEGRLSLREGKPSHGISSPRAGYTKFPPARRRKGWPRIVSAVGTSPGR